eukprot:12139529-Karenia_brevis.AAC.1
MKTGMPGGKSQLENQRKNFQMMSRLETKGKTPAFQVKSLRILLKRGLLLLLRLAAPHHRRLLQRRPSTSQQWMTPVWGKGKYRALTCSTGLRMGDGVSNSDGRIRL